MAKIRLLKNLLVIGICAIAFYATYTTYNARTNFSLVYKALRKQKSPRNETYKTNCTPKTFKRVLLLLNFNHPFYDNIPLLKDLYEGVFERIIFCGSRSKLQSEFKPDLFIDEEKGHRGYRCMTLAMIEYPGYQGYMFGNDDLVINWWTMTDENREKVWHGAKTASWHQTAFGQVINPEWFWWATDGGIKACQSYHNHLKDLAEKTILSKTTSFKKSFDTYIRNGNGRPRCPVGWSDFFYVPGNYSKQFIELSNIAYSCNLFLEIAVHTILGSLTMLDNIVIVNGVYIPEITGTMTYKEEYFWKFYNHTVAFVHPFKFNGPNIYKTLSKFINEVMDNEATLIACR